MIYSTLNMNIWLLTNEYPPFYGGGIGTYAQIMSQVFSDAGHKITVFTLGRPKDSLTSGNLRIIKFEKLKFTRYTPIGESDSIYNELDWLNTLPYQFYNIVIEELKKSPPPDIIEVQDCLGLGYYLLKMKKLGFPTIKNIPIVINMHTPLSVVRKENLESAYRLRVFLLEHLEKQCTQMADAVICPSEFLKNKLQDWCPEKEISILRLPSPKIKTNRAVKIDSKNFKIDLLYIGRLEYRKGSKQLLAGAERLWEKGINFNLVLVGGDEFYQTENCLMGEYFSKKYEKYIELGCLKIINNLPPAHVHALINKTKIFVMPSLYENFPYVCIEAMTIGKPILASRSGGQAEMVGHDNSCGAVFDWAIPNDFENKLEYLLKSTALQLWRMGMNSKKKIRKLCNHKNVLSEKEKVFKKIIADHKNQYSYIEQSTKELASIIIPFQDNAPLLAKTLESIFKSDYPNKEIIIVNVNCYRQDSLDILKEIETSDFPNLKIIHSSSDNLAKSLNLGAKTAKGNFLGFINPGDLVGVTFYSQTINLLQNRDDIGFAYSWVSFSRLPNPWESDIWPTLDVEIPLFLAFNTVPSIAVVKKTPFIHHGLYNEDITVNQMRHESWLRIYCAGYKGVAIPEVLSNMYQKALRTSIDALIPLHPALFKKHSVDLLCLINAS